MDYTALTGAISFTPLVAALGVGFVALIGFSIWKSGGLQIWQMAKSSRRG